MYKGINNYNLPLLNKTIKRHRKDFKISMNSEIKQVNHVFDF